MGAQPECCCSPAVAQALDTEMLKATPARRKTGQRVHIVCDCTAGSIGAGRAGTSGNGRGEAAAGCAYYTAAAAAAAGRQLYRWEEAPPVLQYNKFIRSGYRAGLSYTQCACSIFQCHNETGNILTHLLPALGLLVLLGRQLATPWPLAQMEFWHNVGSILLCFTLSVCYHTCMANHHSYSTWLKLDVCGVLLVLVGGGHMVLWWGFHCHAVLRTLFALCYYAAGAACIYAAVSAHTQMARAVPMLVLLLLRVASFVVRMAVSSHPTPALWHYFAMEAYSLAGGAINSLRIPERWFQPADPAKPAPLDYWFNSHQIMHCCVALAMMHLHLGAAQDYHTVISLREGSLQCAAVAT